MTLAALQGRALARTVHHARTVLTQAGFPNDLAAIVGSYVRGE